MVSLATRCAEVSFFSPLIIGRHAPRSTLAGLTLLPTRTRNLLTFHGVLQQTHAWCCALLSQRHSPHASFSTALHRASASATRRLREQEYAIVMLSTRPYRHQSYRTASSCSRLHRSVPFHPRFGHTFSRYMRRVDPAPLRRKLGNLSGETCSAKRCTYPLVQRFARVNFAVRVRRIL